MKKTLFLFCWLFCMKGFSQDLLPSNKCDYIVYRVQIASYKGDVPDSVKQLFLDSLKMDVFRRWHPSGIKIFQIGEYKQLQEAQMLKENLIQIGYKDAFIVTYLHHRISAEDAIKECE